MIGARANQIIAACALGFALSGAGCRKRSPLPPPEVRVEAGELQTTPPAFIHNESPGWLTQPAPPSNEWERRFAEAESPQAKISILEEKAATGADQLFGLIKLALADGTAGVGITAMTSAMQLRGQEAIDTYSAIPFHDDADTRTVGIEAMRELPTGERLAIQQRLITTAGGEDLVKLIGDLSIEAKKPALGVLLQALDSNDGEIRKHLDDATNRLIGQRFGSRAEAEAWWSTHSSRFDEKLHEIKR